MGIISCFECRQRPQASYGAFYFLLRRAKSAIDLPMLTIARIIAMGIVIIHNHGNVPQKQFASLHEQPVKVSEICAPAIPTINGDSPTTTHNKSRSGSGASTYHFFFISFIVSGDVTCQECL